MDLEILFSLSVTVMNQSHFGIRVTDLFNSLILNKIRDVVFRLIFKSSDIKINFKQIN